MATFTYTDPKTGFFYSYDDAEPTIKDQIRGLIGDIQGQPIWYISDNSIVATASYHNNDLYTSAAECAEKCATRCLSLHEQIRQGTRFEIKNFDLVKTSEQFYRAAGVLRNKSTIGTMPSYGSLGGKIVVSG